MSHVSPNQDLRRSYRFPVPEAGREAELLVGAAWLPVELLDESSGGFAVRAAGPVSLEAGDKSRLHTFSGTFDVRVTHVVALPAQPAPAEADSPAAPAWRIGFVRLDEIVEDGPPTGWRLDRLRFQLRSLASVSWIASILGVGVVAIACALPLWYLTGWWQGDSAPSRRADDSTSALAPWRGAAVGGKPGGARPGEIPPPRDSRNAARPASSGSRSSGGATSGGEGPPSRIAEAPDPAASEPPWFDTIRRLPGPTALLAPQVVEYLGLRDEQRGHIERIAETVSQRLRGLEIELRGLSRQERSRREAEVLEQSRNEAVGLLNGSQRARWNELLRGQEGSPR